MKQGNKLSILTIAYSFAIVLVCALGVTFAYFSVKVTGNDTAKGATISSGKLLIDFETSQYISNSKAMLIKDTERASKADHTDFTVKHNSASTTPAKYNIYLTGITISDNFKSADVKWELLKNGTAIKTGNFASIGTATTIPLTTTAIDLPLGQTDSFVFRLWLSETDQDQLSLTNGSFKGKIMVEAVNS